MRVSHLVFLLIRALILSNQGLPCMTSFNLSYFLQASSLNTANHTGGFRDSKYEFGGVVNRT